jgi:DNA-binding NtrC family response regulator
MGEQKKRKPKVMIIEDEEDNLILYKDYLTSKGHKVSSYLTTDNVMIDFDKILPDISIIDHRLSGDRTGVDVATEILRKYPWSAVLFITAYEPLRNEIISNIFFKDKNIQILIKPVKLADIETAILNLIDKSRASYTPYS